MPAHFNIVERLDNVLPGCASCQARLTAEGPFLATSGWTICKRCLHAYAKEMGLLVADAAERTYELLLEKLAKAEETNRQNSAAFARVFDDLREVTDKLDAAELRASTAETALAERETLLDRVDSYLGDAS